MFMCQTFPNEPGKYCVSACSPAPAFVSNGRLQRVGCPSRAVCLPDYNDMSTGLCLPECQIDTDCQTDAGFFCRNTFVSGGSAVQTSNGYCAPRHCSTRACASSYVCAC